MEKKKPQHYVDNKVFLAAMIEYRNSVKLAEKEGRPKPIIPNYVGDCMLKIATRLSYRPNFVNYSYRDEMISDGIENCINYIDNFNPEKSDNPFAYFTQIIYYAFLRRIQKEKKQLYIKHKSLENSFIFNELTENPKGMEHGEPAYINLDNPNMSDFIKSFEENLVKKRKKTKQGLEEYLDEEDEVDEGLLGLKDEDSANN